MGVPFLLLQHSGIANASLMAGMILPLQNTVQFGCLLGAGCLAAWLGAEMLVQLPISALLMILLGALVKIDTSVFAEVQHFILGAVMLFAFSMSIMRHSAALLLVAPVAVGAYFLGGIYITAIPEGVLPLYFLVGTLESSALIIATGMALNFSLMEILFRNLGRVRAFSSIASFFSFF